MLFNEIGRNIPSKKCRVFSDTPKTFYKIEQLSIDYAAQHKLAQENGLVDQALSPVKVETELQQVARNIQFSDNFKNLFNGPAIPFCMLAPNCQEDLGTQLENNWLPMLKKEYERQRPGAYFKATLQGNTDLSQSIKISKDSGYERFLGKKKSAHIAGFFFPTAFQEFDIESQRRRIVELPNDTDLELSLSGPFEMVYSLIAYPSLLFSKNNYSPILCASALEHEDPRMVMMFKSYGPHLEFWLMTQMLTPTKTQVSEQWSGGITLFKTL